MEIRIEDELFARAIGRDVLRFLRREKKDYAQEINSDALKILEKIKCILDDDTAEDPECFERIEQIVDTFYAYGIYTTRHDWG